MVERYSEETGVRVIPFQELAYNAENDRYEKNLDGNGKTISGAQVREYLNRGEELPSWFTRSAVAQILSEAFPPRHKHGFCVWFTGLSGAGKSTTAEILTELLLEHGRRVTLLDGDVVRTHLSKGLARFQ